MARRPLSHPDRAARFSFEGAAIRLSAAPAAAPRFLANASWRHVLDTAPLRALIAWAAEDHSRSNRPRSGTPESHLAGTEGGASCSTGGPMMGPWGVGRTEQGWARAWGDPRPTVNQAPNPCFAAVGR